MSGWSGRPGNGSSRRLFLEPTPPLLNHMVVTGTLTGDPQFGQGPAGDAVAHLPIAVPVFDPERPQSFLTWASCEVEVPDPLVTQEIRDLGMGTFVLAAGQLSQRVVERGVRRTVLLAVLVHPEQPPDPPGLFVVGGSPDSGPNPPRSSGAQARPERARPRDCEGPKLRRASLRRR
jgi:hypothetical protein